MTCMNTPKGADAFLRHPALCHLSEAEVQQFGAEVEAIGDRVMNSRGERDARYIRRVIAFQRTTEVVARLTIYAGILYFPLFFVGAALLGLAKILENMEIGHNVMHGQWDWLQDPTIHSKTWEWDNVCPAEHWTRAHNYLHHTWTNVIGVDRDFGYLIIRFSDKQAWHPGYLLQPISNALLALLFQWGVAAHDDELSGVRRGKYTYAQMKPRYNRLWRKIGRQLAKDYLLFPLLAGPYFLWVALANLIANGIRNVWAYAVIFCGHFPEGVQEFLPEEVEGEDKGRWYLRQLLGSANIRGGRLMHLLTGNLSHQIEHHLWPRMPSNRYAEVAPQVEALCQRYGLPYNSYSMPRQIGTVWLKVFKYALPRRQYSHMAAAQQSAFQS